MLRELITFTIAAMIFFTILHIWHNYLSPWRDPNRELLDNAEEWEEDNDRMNVIGQNGNDGLHYTGIDTTDGTKVVTYEQKLGDSEQESGNHH